MLLFCAKYGRFKRACESVLSKLKEKGRICTTLTNFATILTGCCGICRKRWTGSLSDDIGLHACPTCIQIKAKKVSCFSNEEKAAITANLLIIWYEGFSGEKSAYQYPTVWNKKFPIMPPQWVVEERLTEGFEEARLSSAADVQKRAAKDVAMKRELAEMCDGEEPQRRPIAAELHNQEVRVAV
eukprot:CAMPEP_0173209748 /NCGR_PEP_ID=MMETSP1141-20130122/23271_1 /TAXON_ID=483371 /ORGANISM="non described non described, Strain CCMP2298" /LENGTH=183 /DNA_ID=CAMNT_0014136399 /DNA_START=88 /DNA_END=636 /DNA_ORIENTATION=+